MNMSNIPKVLKINDPKTLQLVSKLAEEDNDNMKIPTHAVMKGNEIVGGWNLCEVPMVLLWHHSKKVGAKEYAFTKRCKPSIHSLQQSQSI